MHRLSEVESVCTEKLRDMEAQVNTARREHTKAGTVHINQHKWHGIFF